MGFTPSKSVRISSLTPGAVVELRFGKSAVKHKDDSIVVAKFLRHYEEGDKSLAVFEETDADGKVSETTIYHYPSAPWKCGSQFISLLAVDESTYSIPKPTSLIQTEVFDEAIKLVELNADDVFAYAPLLDLLRTVREGKRVNSAQVKVLTNALAKKLVEELSVLEPVPTA